MIAVDTNILVRLLTKDDKSQFQKALILFKKNSIFISLTVLQETEWVLRFSYEFDTNQINNAISGLLGLASVEVEKPMAISKTLTMHKSGMDFSDAIHLAQSERCDFFYTFDKKLISKSINNDICEVREP
ncbi:MAG: type II toxin-antitoxin system VapC family toxin [Pseudomonadales bacterium]